jgi:hypothetical protein
MITRPILFSGAMVRALLDGSKTQTRRAVKQQPPAGYSFAGWCVSSTHRPDEGKATWTDGEGPFMRGAHRVKCPYGQPGDRLWVRETFCDLGDGEIEYRADGECDPNVVPRWTPSIHMPRAASRILLEIVSVRVERLQDISAADAKAEGVRPDEVRQISCFGLGQKDRDALRKEAAVRPYTALWESINGAGSWNANPWVWVVEFKQVAP